MKLSRRLKEISDAIHSAKREQLGISICYKDWVEASKDCPNHHGTDNGNQLCDEFRNRTDLCSPLYCPIVLNYKGEQAYAKK